MDASISVERIEEAARLIDPVFLDTPQFDCEPLSRRLHVDVVLKVECVNPIRSFKGRGTDYLLHRLEPDTTSLVCASAGNFGQGMAHACRRAGRRLTVFAATTASPIKVERMRDLGAEVLLDGADFDEAKAAAMRHANEHGARYVEDGLLGPIAEGAGTIARELTNATGPLDEIFVPLGNGSLINGMGTWLRAHSPSTRVIAVASRAAPAMQLSWESRTPVTAPSTTIADGIAVRVPVPEALELMRGTVDEVMLISDDEMVAAMRMLFADAGVVVEPAGAAGLAAIAQRKGDLAGRRVATPLTGGNLTEQQIRTWIL
ncbi:MAG TPA: pyridoxal-phosphate dependent enzyme [Candidatus Dormibacteraeota bacterium]|nr:pyridoxal-phosphate dependent enzyme [Candidatus Dormibacteraeota bacterium]